LGTTILQGQTCVSALFLYVCLNDYMEPINNKLLI